jgi:predicted Zn-dependent protease
MIYYIVYIKLRKETLATITIMSILKAALFSIVIALPVLSGCMVNPVTLESQFNVVSEEREINIGRQAHPEILKQLGYYQNQELQRYINEIGQKLVKVCKRKDIAYHFTVLDTPMENAFAVPGGYIYITRGLLAFLNSEAELASVLGHEIGHVVGRDSAHQMSQAMLGQIAVLAGAVGGATSSGGDVAQATSLLLNSVMLANSREKEYLADSQGIEYMYKAGYDPMGMAAFQRNLSQISQGPSGMLGYTTTHPYIFDRVDRSTAKAKVTVAMDRAMSQINSSSAPGDKPQNSNGLILADKYLEYIDGLAYGPKENLRHIKIYTVMEGETLSSIAKKTLGSDSQVKELAELNGIPPQMQLVAGTKIKTIY